MNEERAGHAEVPVEDAFPLRFLGVTHETKEDLEAFLKAESKAGRLVLDGLGKMQRNRQRYRAADFGKGVERAEAVEAEPDEKTEKQREADFFAGK